MIITNIMLDISNIQFKFPDHFPNDPYTLEQIHDAMQFVLHGPTPTPTMPEENNNNNSNGEPPVHPFARGKDAMYAPPTTNNITVKQRPPPPKKPDVPLRTTTLIYDPQVASTVYVWTMDLQITITQCELLLLSPEVRNQVREATSNQCIIRTGTPPAPVN